MDYLQLLTAERDKLDRAISILGVVSGPARRRGRPPKGQTEANVNPAAVFAVDSSAPSRKRKPRSAASRKAQAEKMRQFWAKRRRKAKKAA